MNVPEKAKLHCNACLGLRWHTVLFSKLKERRGKHEDGQPYVEHTDYTLAECSGCEAITLETSYTSSIFTTPLKEQWPPKVSRGAPRWMFDLYMAEASKSSPVKHDNLMEIYSSLRAGNLWLAVLGVRALLEQVMIENVGDQGTFRKNIEAFQVGGFISALQRMALEPVIEAGHASMHRKFKASEVEVGLILDITENIIESIYVMQIRANGLKVPPRSTS